MATPDSLSLYYAKVISLLLAVGVLTFLLMQLGQLHKSSESEPSAASASAPAVQQPSASNQPTPMQSLPPGEGPLKTTSRIVEPRYVVVPGDTLGTIATKFGTSVEALQSINNLPDRNVLSVGQKLVIPNQD